MTRQFPGLPAGAIVAAVFGVPRRRREAVIRIFFVIAGVLLLLLPAVLGPPEGLSREGAVALALLAVMALWWFTEALPVTATALLPFLVLPAAGVGKPAEVAASFMSPVIFLVLGGALLALAIEKSGLHRRIAVAVVSRAGASPRRLVLAFMAATAFLSMWISNTASALIMMPIAVSVLAAVLPAPEARGADQRRFAIALVLGVAYSASIGGLGTLIGSPTNAIAAGILDRSLGVKLGFAQWLAIGLPLVAMTIPAGWWLLTRVACRFELPDFERATVIEAFSSQRGWSPAERRLLPLLLAAVAAWVLLPLLKIPALSGVEDASIAILAALALFVIPAGRPLAPGTTLLEWRDTARAPWDVLFLFGGGLALADAITRTGLGTWLGDVIGELGTLPLPVFVLLVTLTVIAVTEFASNVAAAASFIPVVAGVTLALGLDPLVLTLPAALAASWGFMMPAGTPPNAIAYATGTVTVAQMIRAGLWFNLLGLVAIPAAVAFGVTTFLRG